jgi:hypothetical protein
MSWWTKFRDFLKTFLIIVALIIVAILFVALAEAMIPALGSAVGAGSTVWATTSAVMMKIGIIGMTTTAAQFWGFAVAACAVGAWAVPDQPTPEEMWESENRVSQPTADQLQAYVIQKSEEDYSQLQTHVDADGTEAVSNETQRPYIIPILVVATMMLMRGQNGQ